MSAVGAPRPILSAGFWRAYWITSRPYLFFVSAASGLVGLVLAGPMSHLRFGAAFAVFFFSYGLGQALTDVFQTDTDARSAPYRPLVRGEVSRWQIAAVSLAGLAACAVVMLALSPWTLLLSCLAVGGLVTYTPLKRRWWGGPVWNAWIVALLPALGFATGVAPVAGGRALLVLAMGSVFFSYAVFVLLGYLKDVEADRATGYETLPVRFGRCTTVVVSAVFLAASIVSSLALLVAARVPARAGVLGLPGLVLLAGGAGTLVAAHVRAFGTTRDEEAHPAVAMVVLGYVALHLGTAALLRPALACPAILLCALLDAALRARPERTQV